MRSVKLFLGILLLSVMSFSALAAVPFSSLSVTPAATSDGAPTVSKKQQRLVQMKWFVSLSAREYGKMRGKKLNFFERLSFKLTQNRMKQQLKAERAGDSEGVNWGGLALGLFLSVFGVIGAYIFSEDSNLIKWAWIGCGISALIWLLVVL